MKSNTNNDWMSALEALRGSMADEPETIETETGVDAELVAQKDASRQSARLDIVLDRKGRKGKSATIIEGFTIPDDEVEALAARLKRQLGTGGSARGGEILVQGDRRTDVLRFLSAQGFKARIL